MFANLNGWHLLILLAVILLLFGAARLPSLAKSVGQSARILRGEIRTDDAAAPARDTVARDSGRATPQIDANP
ncbi:twin-arginine translocase TatA/TatE family subunit [Microbacterium sp. B2969]|uniref:Sec-independent protein translocase protein TatA n=1 Tax=Microbacterium alkaliflavum TaxID=3248839 RepID=A0ABW7QD40_9MICO